MTDDFNTSLARAPARPLAPVRPGWRRRLVEEALAVGAHPQPVAMLALLLIVCIGLQALRWAGKTF